MQLFFLEVAFEEGTGDVIIVLVGDRIALSRVSCLDGVLLFDGCWREGDPVWKRKKSKPLNHIESEAHSHWTATRRKETREEKRRRWVKNKQINNLFADDIFTDLMSSFSILTLQLNAPLIIIWYDDCDGGYNVIIKKASSSITVLFALLFNIEDCQGLYSNMFDDDLINDNLRTYARLVFYVAVCLINYRWFTFPSCCSLNNFCSPPKNRSEYKSL